MGERTFYVRISYEDRPDRYLQMKTVSVFDAAEQIRKRRKKLYLPRYSGFVIQEHPFNRGPRPGRVKGYQVR